MNESGEQLIPDLVRNPEKRILFDPKKSIPSIRAISEYGLQILQAGEITDSYVRLQDGGLLNISQGTIEDIYHNPQDIRGQDASQSAQKSLTPVIIREDGAYLSNGVKAKQLLSTDYFAYRQDSDQVQIIHKGGWVVGQGYVPRKINTDDLEKISQFVSKYNTDDAKRNDAKLRLGGGVILKSETVALFQQLALQVEGDINSEDIAGILVPLRSLDGRYQTHLFARCLNSALLKYKEIFTAEEWRAIGESILGKSHERKGLPTQDALRITETQNGDHLVAVSDGHGSIKSFRSERGAQYAVDVLTKQLIISADRIRSGDLSSARSYIQTKMPSLIVEEWRKRVQADIQANPFEQSELTRLAGQDGESAVKQINKNPLLAYGATLLGAAQIGEELVFLALGDGDIILTDRHGNIIKPLKRDPQLLGNETTSLCQPDAVSNTQVRMIKSDALSKPMIMVATDGLSNSYRTDEDFFAFPKDIYPMEDQAVRTNLRGWLNKISSGGSGDDITVAFLRS